MFTASTWVAGLCREASGIVDSKSGGGFDAEAFAAGVRTMITAQEIIIDNASYPTEAIGRLLAGYAAILPLERAELDLLPDLMRMRHAATLTIGAWRARRYPANAAYLRRNGAASLRGLTVLDRIGTAAVLDILKRALPPERMP